MINKDSEMHLRGTIGWDYMDLVCKALIQSKIGNRFVIDKYAGTIGKALIQSKVGHRFVVDERIEIVAVRDTWHPEYDYSRCLSSAPDIVVSWPGVWNESVWYVSIEDRENAAAVCHILNGAPGPSPEDNKPKPVMSLREELKYLIRVIVRDELENQANS